MRQADGRVPPHLALLIAWLDAAAPALRHVNGFTARHLQFQLQQVLGFSPQPARPDRAHLLVELRKGAAPFEVAAGQRFSAGKDGTGVERVYAAVRASPIGAVRVAQLRSLRRDGERLLCAPQADSADGLGEPLAGPEPRWPPFGPEEAPAAPVGFAVATALLQLAGGTRRIELRLELSGRQPRHTDAALAASFEAFLTSAKGWIGPLPVTAAWQGDQLQVALTLGPDQAAVVAHDPAVAVPRRVSRMMRRQLAWEPAFAPFLVAFVLVYFAVFGVGIWYMVRLMSAPPHPLEPGAEHLREPIRTAGVTPAAQDPRTGDGA